MKLYHRPDCPFCWKVRIFLKEAGIIVEEIPLALGEKHPEVKRLNPNGTVPVLVDGELTLVESAVIMEYLADKFPQSHLMAGSPAQKARLRQLHSYSDTKVGKVLFPFIKQAREGGLDQVPDDLRESTVDAWFAIQKNLSVQLGEKEFFGPTFSGADCALIPRFTLALAYGLPLDEAFPNLKNWFNRCVARRSFAATLPGKFPGVDEMIKWQILQV